MRRIKLAWFGVESDDFGFYRQGGVEWLCKIRYRYVKNQKHWYHMVTVSPWPLFGAIGALVLTTGGVLYMHNFIGGFLILKSGLLTIIGVMLFWWRDVVREATYEGAHTSKVVAGLRIGMFLFILSEVMFFFSFFWAFFHSALAPSIVLGAIWPPMGLSGQIDPLGIPLLNTLILLTSGVTVTISHYWLCICKPWSVGVRDIEFLLWKCKVYTFWTAKRLDDYKWRFLRWRKYSNHYMWKLDPEHWKNQLWWQILDRHVDIFGYFPSLADKHIERIWPPGLLVMYEKKHITIENHIKEQMVAQIFGKHLSVIPVLMLMLTILLAIDFTAWQGFEYYDALFYISDSVYGSTFYVTTGFHGLHVIIGTIFLIIGFFRLRMGHFRFDHHFGFEAAIWYWHFVDVVWLFLYVFIYCWGPGFNINLYLFNLIYNISYYII